MFKTDPVTVAISNYSATITLNRPQKGNSITPAVMEYLINTLPDLAADPNVRVVIFTGAGKYFCTGLDLSNGVWPSNEPITQRIAWFSNQDIQLVELIRTFPKPVIARINGPAIGGGLLFLFASDIRFAIDTAYLQFPEVHRGFLPKFTPPFVVNLLGKHNVMEYVLTGRRVPILEVNKNILNGVVSTEAALDALVQACVDKLIDGPPRVIANAKQLINLTANGGDKDYDTRVLLATKDINDEVMKRHEARDGIKSFNINKQNTGRNISQDRITAAKL